MKKKLIKYLFVFVTLIICKEFSASNRYWIGGLSTNWNDVNNWGNSSGLGAPQTIPIAGDSVIFDGGGLSNCMLTSNINIGAINVLPAYTGIINQNANTILITSTSTWQGGTFIGGNLAFTNNGSFTLSGANFTSTSGILTVNNTFRFSSGSFIHNNGTVVFTGNFSISGSPIFNNLKAFASSATNLTINNSFSVNGDFTIDAPGFANTIDILIGQTVTVNGNLIISGNSIVNIKNGTIDAKGNITTSNSNISTNSNLTPATIQISGIANQTITGSGVIKQGSLPYIIINKPSGTLFLVSYINVVGPRWNYMSGTIDPGTSTVCFYNSGTPGGNFIISGSQTLYNVVLYGFFSVFNVNNDLAVNNLTLDATTRSEVNVISSITVNGNLRYTAGGYCKINTGVVNVKGDFTDNNNNINSGGTGTLIFNGTANQTLTGSGIIRQGSLPNVIINKTSGTLFLMSYITTVGTSWNYVAGAVDPGVSTVCFYSLVGPNTISGSQPLNDAVFYPANSTTTINNNLTINNLTIDATGGNGNYTINSSLTINGTLLFSGANFLKLNTGTCNAKGDIINNNTSGSGGGTANFIVNGAGNQLFTGTPLANQGLLPPFIINKTSGTLTLANYLSFFNGFNFIAGTVNPGASTCVFAAIPLGLSQSINASGMSFNNIVFGQPHSLWTNLNTNLDVKGDLTILALSGINLNNNNINIGGNFTSLNTTAVGGNYVIKPNTSTITFNGSGAGSQIITMNNPTSTANLATFYNVVINNNSARASFDDLTLVDILTVKNSIVFTKGKMLTSSTKYLFLQNAATSNIGNVNSYVNGPMKYEMGFNGMRTLNFPIGKSTDWRPTVLTLTHNAATSYTYTSEVFISDATLLGYTLPLLINTVSHVHYWQIDRSSPSLDLTSAVAQLYYGGGGINDDGVTDPISLRIVKTIDVGATWNDIGGVGSDVGNGSITSTINFTSFCKFTLANDASKGNNPLPIQLISFDAVSNQDNVELIWKTASQTINDFFTVEKSVDGVSFENVDIVDGCGTCNFELNYSLIDRNPYNGISYYRLKQTDFNNDFSYSNIETVEFNNNNNFSFNLFPNPTNNKENLYFSFSGSKGKEILVVVYNAIGETNFSKVLMKQTSADNVYVIDESKKLSPGVYLIVATSDQTIYRKKLIVEEQ